eukprot:TRINITY_DN10833_c0_g1_i1.p1 TRINITY_DN10833_c0_g1~~TRINITY_DN10833_c0_g1_i1.p1  ORF type:complete len:372 (-),score=84.98 TRINITY_DN10833_c0_g1_i1:92-1207(-)
MSNLSKINLFKRKAHVEKTADSESIKLGLRRVEELKLGIQKLSKSGIALQEKGTLHYRNGAQLGQLMALFPEKDRAQPVPGQNPEESGFLMGMQKFADIFMDLANLESSFCDETSKFSIALQQFIDGDLTETTKFLKKAYDQTRADYDKILTRIATLKDNKKLPIVKLYEAEKERARQFKVYDKAMRALEDHLADLDDLLNIIIATTILDWAAAHKNTLGLSYGQLNDIKEYLASLKTWCQEEENVCKMHRKERDGKRAEARAEEIAHANKEFAQLWTLDLIHIASSVGMDSQQMISSFCVMFHQFGVPLPEGLEKFPGATLDKNAVASIDIKDFLRQNFDAIGSKLLEDGERDLLVKLGEALAQIELPPV